MSVPQASCPLPQQSKSKHLVRNVGREHRRDLRRAVELRRNLDDIEGAEIQPGERPDERERLVREQAADLRRPGPWREAWIDDVDVEGKERRPGADLLARPAAVFLGREG